MVAYREHIFPGFLEKAKKETECPTRVSWGKIERVLGDKRRSCEHAQEFLDLAGSPGKFLDVLHCP